MVIDNYLSRIKEIQTLHTKYIEEIKSATNTFISELNKESSATTSEAVKGIVCNLFGIRREVLDIRSRASEILRVRELYVFLMYLYLEFPQREVAVTLRYDRSSMNNNCKAVINEYQTNPDYRNLLHKILPAGTYQDCITKFENRKNTNRKPLSSWKTSKVSISLQ